MAQVDPIATIKPEFSNKGEMSVIRLLDKINSSKAVKSDSGDKSTISLFCKVKRFPMLSTPTTASSR